MCRAIRWLLSRELLLLLEQEVAQPPAECLGRTQLPRVPVLASCSLGMCCPWGWLRVLLHGGTVHTDQATAPVRLWPWLSQMGFIEDTWEPGLELVFISF